MPSRWRALGAFLLSQIVVLAKEVEVLSDGEQQGGGDTYSVDEPSADHRSKGIELDEADDIVGAIESFGAATQFTPSDSAWFNYGVALADERNPQHNLATFELAKSCFEQALDLDPENDDAAENYEALLEDRWTYLPNGTHDVPMPRLTLEQLRMNETYLNVEAPFILVGAQKDWLANKRWTLDYISEKFGEGIVDFYPENMRNIKNKPFLQPMENAIEEFRKFQRENGRVKWGDDPPYIQWRMPYSAIETIHANGDVRWPFHVRHDLQWMRQCMPDRDNMIRHAQWNMMSIGMHGSGMFNHPDGKGMSSMAVQVQGRKRWMICESTMDEYLYHPGDLDTFAPDLERFPKFAKANCSDVTAEPGDIIFYPYGTWHQTYNLDQLTLSVQSRMSTRSNFMDIYKDLKHHCENPPPDYSKQWPGISPNLSEENCAGLDECLEIWQGWFQGDTPFNFSIPEPSGGGL